MLGYELMPVDCSRHKVHWCKRLAAERRFGRWDLQYHHLPHQSKTGPAGRVQRQIHWSMPTETLVD